MLEKLFQSLKEKKQDYLNARAGEDFEERIMVFLKQSLGLTRLLKADVAEEDWKKIKAHIGDKLGTDFMDLPNPQLAGTFVYQPYGSQQFPDLLVFTDKKVVPVEVKFSTNNQAKPVWNSNVPRANAFYIFGSYGLKDITFFLGEDVLSPEHRKALYGFFKDIRELQEKIREKIPELDGTMRGFTPYIRAAFDQKKHRDGVVMNFFAHPDRERAEEEAIERAKEL